MISTCLCALGPVSSRPSSEFSGCLCLSSGTSIPIKMLALRYLIRLLYRLDGWYLVLYHNWEIKEGCACGLGTCVSVLRVARRTSGSVLGQDRGRPTVPSFVLRRSASQDRSWRELPIESDMSVKFPRMLVPKIQLSSTRNSLPVPKGSRPAVVAECFVTFVIDCEAFDQWKTVSDWTAQPLMESTSTLAPPEARRRKVTPEGRNIGGQVVCAATADILWRRNVFQRKVHGCRNKTWYVTPQRLDWQKLFCWLVLRHEAEVAAATWT